MIRKIAGKFRVDVLRPLEQKKAPSRSIQSN
jgi:hypothetical protein